MAKKYSLYSPTANVQRRLYRRSRQSQLWASVAVGLWMLKAMRRISARRPEVVAVDRLKPGESMTITTIPAPSRRERKAAKRAGTTPD